MNLQNINKLKNQKGFTIVELLIVIVVIGILAAIIIVAYQGVTARANTSNANSAASSIMKKVEAYAAEEGSYPSTASTLTATSNSSKSYSVIGSGVTFQTTAMVNGTKPDSPTTLNYYTCGTAGNKIGYYDYSDKQVKFVYAGAATSTTTCAPTTPVNP